MRDLQPGDCVCRPSSIADGACPHQVSEHNATDREPSTDTASLPSSPPMTLRQQLDGLMTRYTLQSDVRKGDEIVHYLDDHAKSAIESLCQEIAREAVRKEWKAITEYIDQSSGFDWYPSDFKAYRDKRLAQQDTRSTVSDTERSEIATGQLTQKPPQPKENT